MESESSLPCSQEPSLTSSMEQGPSMALGSTQPLTEKSTSSLPVGKGRPARKADNDTAIYEPIV
jgi:hypothetical protein